jgi:hypothetical protein
MEILTEDALISFTLHNFKGMAIIHGRYYFQW